MDNNIARGDLDDQFFKDAGFDTTKEPFTKAVPYGTTYVFKNYARDGSGHYDGYCVVRPRSSTARTITDFFADNV